MSELRGTNLAAPIVPFTTEDSYATHEAKYGKGGFRTVSTIEERNAIPSPRLEEGMLVYVINDPMKTHTYQYINGEWTKSKIGAGVEKVDTIAERDLLIPEEGDLVYVNSEKKIFIYRDENWQNLTFDSDAMGIPVYDLDMARRLEEQGKLPDDYISIPNSSEMGVQGSRGYEPGKEGFYVDILFNAIRSLQAEVAKMKNSFKYGMYSYTDTQTAMSAVMSGYNQDDEVEPLWAVEESDLSEIEDAFLDIGDNHTLEPKANVISSEGILKINAEGASWEDREGGILQVGDPKIFLFLTTSSMNFKVHLVNISNPSDKLEIDFSKLNVPTSASKKYNTLFVISRATSEAGEWYGNNFAWISVANYATGISTNEGFWQANNTLSPTTKIIGTASEKNNYRYAIESVEFADLDLYKFNVYSKVQDFTNTVVPNKPTDEDYKYRVAHITIRSVATKSVADAIANQLPKNELIFNEATGGLMIKTASGIKEISGGSSKESGMEKNEIIEWLAKNGIIVTADGGNLHLNNVADVTFIHQGTQKSFKFEVGSDGQLHSTEIPSVSLKDRMTAAGFSLNTETGSFTNYRGVAGKLGWKEAYKTRAKEKENGDLGLFADRIKIGAIYAPYSENQVSYGCSHAYVELENTSDKDFSLDGVYLYFATGKCEESGTDDMAVYSLALEGAIPAGGTFLVRGKQYADFDQANTFIKVKDYDMEWYTTGGNLIDFTLHNNNSFCLVYVGPTEGSDQEALANKAWRDGFTYTTPIIGKNSDTSTKSKAPWTFHSRFIDVAHIGNPVKSRNGDTWSLAGDGGMIAYKVGANKTPAKDCIYKNTFFLDPAKQAFQGLTTYDSSRKRNEKAQDFQYLLLENEEISFPKSGDTTKVEVFTPKPSWAHKNVCTDKSQLDPEKPNMVTCSFGKNIHTTRCFNWISCGYFDEYIWIRKTGATKWDKFESYKKGSYESEVGTADPNISKVTFGTFTNNTTGQSDNNHVQDIIYSRMTGTFPGAGVKYTAHKCILNVVQTADNDGGPVEYQYVVGRPTATGQPDPDHTSEIQTFKLYPTTYTPRVFQVTDQQGFHWIEYQAWAAAAEELNKTINAECQAANIIPILINTGDMTQNGTRINEWLDYYMAGRVLFNHLEQMNVVGNNDLCGSADDGDTPAYEILGTGDDVGKSNAHYFHVFYCYEIDSDTALPIISNANQTRYIPSFYAFGNRANSGSSVPEYRFIMMNTEITPDTCKFWYKQLKDGSTVNVYTGFTIPDGAASPVYDNTFTTVYTMLYNTINKAISTDHVRAGNVILACHEMPFTVITDANLDATKGSVENVDRSLNGTSLVGSHANRMSADDKKANYWLSRLLEHFGLKLCIGGHKHTYACTNPVREFYYYTENGVSKNSLSNGKMTMTNTLENDTATFTTTVGKTGNTPGQTNYVIASSTDTITVNTSKFPLMESSTAGIIKSASTFYPYYGQTGMNGGIVYFMCQATGYKQKSNKELPSPSQKFSYVIPETTVQGTGDTPNDNQLRPMFAEVELGNESHSIYLYRIEHIMSDVEDKREFTQLAYSKIAASYSWLKGNEAQGAKDAMYGNWGYTTKTALINV